MREEYGACIGGFSYHDDDFEYKSEACNIKG
jgi:hypothetical protein